jgi:hypothetical protein
VGWLTTQGLPGTSGSRRRVTIADVDERAACALLKQRFESAGFAIEENRAFDEDGVRFEIDGFDARHRVGYEYVSAEAGDSWDVDDGVIAALEERRGRGELHVLIIDETEAPDADALGAKADAFLAELRDFGVGVAEDAESEAAAAGVGAEADADADADAEAEPGPESAPVPAQAARTPALKEAPPAPPAAKAKPAKAKPPRAASKSKPAAGKPAAKKKSARK